MTGESSRLSLTTAGSSTNAALGAESAGGDGRPLFEVTQSGSGPPALVATQPAGSAGGVTPSKFSVNEVAAPAPTATFAKLEPAPSSVVVNDATLCRVEPHVNSVVWLTTCAAVLAPTASVLNA